MSIRELISKDIDYPVDMLNKAITLARVEVKQQYIPKRNGDKRLILLPSRKLKPIQYWFDLPPITLPS